MNASIVSHCVAGVVELVDTTDSKSVAFASVTVQVRPPVPFSCDIYLI